jgi:hypothetical protein
MPSKTWGKKGNIKGVVLKVNLIFAHFADERKKVMQIVVKCKNT